MGIIRAYIQEIRKLINLDETESKAVLCFKISKRLTIGKQNINRHCACINSKYSNGDLFNMKELEMQELSFDVIRVYMYQCSN